MERIRGVLTWGPLSLLALLSHEINVVVVFFGPGRNSMSQPLPDTFECGLCVWVDLRRGRGTDPDWREREREK